MKRESSSPGDRGKQRIVTLPSVLQTIPTLPNVDDAAPRALRTAFATAASLAEAESFTRELAHSHYENFTVVSLLLPKSLRQDFCNIYAFCRLADDLGDDMPDHASATQALEQFADATRACYAGEARSAVFVALRDTIARHDIPIEPFLDLIDAFEQDQRVTRYETFDQLSDYCRHSANPVGRLVLYVCGYRDAHRQRLSDLTCTALQLANFWQDVRRDLLELDRIYLPREDMERFDVGEKQLQVLRCDDRYRALIEFQVDRTSAMFDKGKALLDMLDQSVRHHIALFTHGGCAVLRAIRRQNYDTLSSRPALSAWQKGRLVSKALAARGRQLVSTGRRSR
jgi:squalene synthase HpnC